MTTCFTAVTVGERARRESLLNTFRLFGSLVRADEQIISPVPKAKQAGRLPTTDMYFAK